MTGFGSVVCRYGNRSYNIEIRSINSKSLDINTKIPAEFKEKELEIRTKIAQLLERGKIDVVFTMEQGFDTSITLDANAVKIHYTELKEIADSLNIKYHDSELFSMALHIGDALIPKKDVFSEEDYLNVLKHIEIACLSVNKSRIEEGKALEKDFILRISLIEKYLEQIEPIESIRINNIKERLQKQLAAIDVNFDQNRFEQELIFYLEKFDFTEEKIRLRKHCNYFKETMTEEIQNGKKLAFISQEIGREINTLGSKASDAEIQKLVVQMKDELEKIKEQLANVL